MNVNPAMPIPTPAMQPGTTPGGQDIGKKTMPTGEHDNAANFSQKLQTQNPTHTPATNNIAANNTGVNKANGVKDTSKVDTQNKVPDNQDMFGQFDKVRGEMDAYMNKTSEIDKMVSDGKLKPNDPKVLQQRKDDMRMLLHFQTEMQSASMKVEIAGKVVDNGTSGIKTVLQTQA